jgi:hypothetical protein
MRVHPHKSVVAVLAAPTAVTAQFISEDCAQNSAEDYSGKTPVLLIFGMDESDRIRFQRHRCKHVLAMFEEHSDLTVVLRHLSRQLLIGGKQPHERPHNAGVDFDRALATQDA